MAKNETEKSFLRKEFELGGLGSFFLRKQLYGHIFWIFLPEEGNDNSRGVIFFLGKERPRLSNVDRTGMKSCGAD